MHEKWEKYVSPDMKSVHEAGSGTYSQRSKSEIAKCKVRVWRLSRWIKVCIYLQLQ